MIGSEASNTVEFSSRDAHARALLALIATLFGLWTIWSTQILPRLPIVDGMTHTLQSLGMRVLLWVVPCGVYLWLRYRRRALSRMRLGLPPTGLHWLVAILIVVVAAFAVSLDVARKLELPPGEVWHRVLENMGLEFPTAELFEELIFRGVILSELLALWGADGSVERSRASLRRRAWLANTASSLVFTGLHWPWWIFTLGFSEPFWMNSAGVFLISLVLGILFIASRSVWPCVVLHWLNNALSSLAG